MKQVDILVVGAGPVGLFTVFEAGLLGLHCHLIDNLDKPGGQCAELYPEKPIYDIPGVPLQTAQEHVQALLEQIKPFDYEMNLNERVEEIAAVPVPGVTDEDGEPMQDWQVRTSEGQEFLTRNLLIAAGAGAFEPRRPTGVDNPDRLLNRGVSYAVRDKSRYQGRKVCIFGGGDSALDWSVELAEQAGSLALVHRRDAFRGAPATEAQMRQLVQQGEIELLTPFVIHDLVGDEHLTAVQMRHFDTGEIVSRPCDEIVFLFGLHKKLGPIADWKLDMVDKKIAVNTENFQTSHKGIFAVGDINDYPGKLDLILCGFHETTLACQEAYRRLNPGERVPFGYTTSHPRLQKLLTGD